MCEIKTALVLLEPETLQPQVVDILGIYPVIESEQSPKLLIIQTANFNDSLLQNGAGQPLSSQQKSEIIKALSK